jgi:hypothetical protein
MYEKYKPTHVIHLAALGVFFALTSLSRFLIGRSRSRRALQKYEIQGHRPANEVRRPPKLLTADFPAGQYLNQRQRPPRVLYPQNHQAYLMSLDLRLP